MTRCLFVYRSDTIVPLTHRYCSLSLSLFPPLLSLSLLARSLADKQPLIAYLRNEALEFNIVGSAEERKASHIGERARQRAKEAEEELAAQRVKEEATFTSDELLDMLATLEREHAALQRSRSGGRGGTDLALAVAKEKVVSLERRLAVQEQRTEEAEEAARSAAQGSKVCVVQ